jgi:hypothetical protein
MHNHFVPKLNRKPVSSEDIDQLVAMLMKNSGMLNGEQI